MGVAFDVTWKQVARHELFLGWKRWASFACIWFWSCLTFGIPTDSLAARMLPGVLSCPNEITLLAAVVTLFFILFLSESIASVVDSRSLMTLSSICLISASLCMVGDRFVGDGLLFILGMALGGISIAFLKIAWGEMYSRMSLRQGLFSMGFALVSSVCLVVVVQALPVPVQYACLLVTAVFCAPWAFQGTRQLKDGTLVDAVPEKEVTFSFSLLLLPALVGLAYGMVKGMLPWIESSDDALLRAARSVAELFAGGLLLAFACRLSRRFGAAQIYSCALVFVVASLALLLLQMTPLWVALGVHEIGFSIFYFFMVVFWGNLSRRTGMGIVRVYAIGYFVFQFVQFLGTIVGYYALEDRFGVVVSAAFLLVILAFFVAVLVLLGSPHSSLRTWLVADDSSEAGDEIPIACAFLADHCRLSPREQEVFSLLARGRNASSVARTLCISPDTAKTHIKNIYRKLDVHTQQELIDLIEQTIASAE